MLLWGNVQQLSRFILPGGDVLGQPQQRPLARPPRLDVGPGPASQEVRPEQPADDSADGIWVLWLSPLQLAHCFCRSYLTETWNSSTCSESLQARSMDDNLILIGTCIFGNQWLRETLVTSSFWVQISHSHPFSFPCLPVHRVID